MIENKDILIVGLQSLDSRIGSNCVNIAHEFAKLNRVLYVNYALDRKTALLSKSDPLVQKKLKVIQGKLPEITEVKKNLWNLSPPVILESTNQISPAFLFRFLNRINNKRFAGAIAPTLRKLGFKSFILFNDSDFYRSFFLADFLNPKLYVYYTRDNMVATKYFRKYGKEFEGKLMKKSDLVVANSKFLQEKAAEYNKNAFYVGQGCDFSLFNNENKYQIPADLQKIPRPRIGYLGALKSSRLDIDLLYEIATGKKNYQIVLVGPEDQMFKKSILHQLDNIHFMGPRKQEELPSYLTGFDVAINPQSPNELTVGNYPRKIDEYLAMGKPTLATKTPSMKVFAKYVYLAEGAKQYISMIEKALEEDSEELSQKRSRFARQHTWKNSVESIYDAIETVSKS
ncbi:MAG: glycosyltransferase [Bacteroidales bacterium]|nr:glycosyltransferase [Bacteroidales bacterium]MCF8351878.1 glycosyltransferase [Bacteroidales bacterium]MCF8375251.1 glycosyltransferase [Bacteroidales bacterium]MCF8400275.1 glycosyltransferase [Bacteroidales bacterium]